MQAISAPRIAITVPVIATTRAARTPTATRARSDPPRRLALIARRLSATCACVGGPAGGRRRGGGGGGALARLVGRGGRAGAGGGAGRVDGRCVAADRPAVARPERGPPARVRAPAPADADAADQAVGPTAYR